LSLNNPHVDFIELHILGEEQAGLNLYGGCEQWPLFGGIAFANRCREDQLPCIMIVKANPLEFAQSRLLRKR